MLSYSVLVGRDQTLPNQHRDHIAHGPRIETPLIIWDISAMNTIAPPPGAHFTNMG